jgi:hypothetical protein
LRLTPEVPSEAGQVALSTAAARPPVAPLSSPPAGGAAHILTNWPAPPLSLTQAGSSPKTAPDSSGPRAAALEPGAGIPNDESQSTESEERRRAPAPAAPARLSDRAAGGFGEAGACHEPSGQVFGWHPAGPAALARPDAAGVAVAANHPVPEPAPDPVAALRSAAAASSPAEALPQASTPEFALRLAPAGREPVEVRVAERQGQVTIGVRTPDPQLQQALRQDLGALIERLEHSGYRAEAFTPVNVSRSATPEPGSAPGPGDRDANPGGRHQQSSNDQQQRRQPPQHAPSQYTDDWEDAA